MKSCRFAHCIAGVDSRDLACVTTGLCLEMQGLLGRSSIHLTNWDESIFANSLAKLLLRVGLRKEAMTLKSRG